ncbi:unnamed protein product, partial [Aureobasidium uvarum]
MAHTFYAWRYRAKYFTALIVGCVFEAVGYIARALSHSHPKLLGPYIMQSMLILIAPPLFAATIYMTLSRIIRLTRIFVISDVLCFLIQGNGGGLQAIGTLHMYSLGADIVIAGLVLQIVVFCLFVAVAVSFHLRLRKQPTAGGACPPLDWEKHMYTLYVASAMILLRNLVRVIEYAQGNDGFVVSHESMLYIFDACMMLAVVVLPLVIHPGQILGRAKAGDRNSGHDHLLQPVDKTRSIIFWKK